MVRFKELYHNLLRKKYIQTLFHVSKNNNSEYNNESDCGTL